MPEGIKEFLVLASPSLSSVLEALEELLPSSPQYWWHFRAAKSWHFPCLSVHFFNLFCQAQTYSTVFKPPGKEKPPASPPCQGPEKNNLARKKHSSLPEPVEGFKVRKGEYKGGTRRGLEQPRFVRQLKATNPTWT